MELTPFDSRINSPALQMIKLLIPYLPPSNQRMLAVYIKLIEFQNTFSSFTVFQPQAATAEDMLNEIRPYIPSDIYQPIDAILNMMNLMSIMRNVSEDSVSDPAELLKNILTPEQQDIFNSYNTIFSEEQGGTTNA